MRLLLRHSEQFNRLATVGPGEDIRVLPRLLAWRKRGEPVVGTWSDLGHRRLALYSDGLRLHLRVDDEELDLGPELEAHREIGPRGQALLHVFHFGDLVLDLPYHSQLSATEMNGMNGQLDRFDQAPDDDEDHDYGLYLAQTINSPKRQAWLIERARRVLSDRVLEYKTPTLADDVPASGSLWDLVRELGRAALGSRRMPPGME